MVLHPHNHLHDLVSEKQHLMAWGQTKCLGNCQIHRIPSLCDFRSWS